MIPITNKLVEEVVARALAKRGGFSDTEPYCDFHIADARAALAVAIPLIGEMCAEIADDHARDAKAYAPDSTRDEIIRAARLIASAIRAATNPNSGVKP